LNKFSPLVQSLAESILISGIFFLIVYFFGPELVIRSLLFLSGIVFSIAFVIVYFSGRILIYRRLRELYVNINKYRKTDTVSQAKERADSAPQRLAPTSTGSWPLFEPGNVEEEMEFSQDVIGDINREVKVWAEERKEEVDRLKKLETYRKEYLGNVSHELKTPIFNIQGYVLTLLDGGLEDKTINRDYLQRAENSVERMIGIVDDLEAITQLESGQLELDIEKFDLNALTKEILKAEEMMATAKGIIFSQNNPEDKPIFVFADKFRIKQVLTNLLVNSIIYGKEYGETKLKFSDIGDQIRVEISDNGMGINEKHLPRLFERFYRVDKHRSREQGGTGLGLAIVKHILEAHHQTISVMSTEGVGSVFSFTLKKS